MEVSTKSFAVDGSERSVQDIVSKLKFISKIREGEKLDVKSLTLGEGFKDSVYRTFVARNESRYTTLEFIRMIVHEAFDLASKYLQKEEKFFKDIGKMVITSLNECKSGLLNLIKTYSEDRMYISRLETLMTTLETKTIDLQRQILPEKTRG